MADSMARSARLEFQPFVMYLTRMAQDLTAQPLTDPTQIYRYRDGLYAEDMLITALVWLDLFSWIDKNESDFQTVCQSLDLKIRPADVMLTLLTAMQLIELRNEKYSL